MDEKGKRRGQRQAWGKGVRKSWTDQKIRKLSGTKPENRRKKKDNRRIKEGNRRLNQSKGHISCCVKLRAANLLNGEKGNLLGGKIKELFLLSTMSPSLMVAEAEKRSAD